MAKQEKISESEQIIIQKAIVSLPDESVEGSLIDDIISQSHWQVKEFFEKKHVPNDIVDETCKAMAAR